MFSDQPGRSIVGLPDELHHLQQSLPLGLFALQVGPWGEIRGETWFDGFVWDEDSNDDVTEWEFIVI